ncbi:MAG: ABC transporter substrate-binding protein [Gemmatimonadales bacterium]
MNPLSQRGEMLGRVSHAALVVVACGTLSACDSAQHGATSASGGDSLVVGVGGDEADLKLNRQRLGRYPLNAGICEPLLRLRPDFGVEPWLANTWEYKRNNTYRFTLRHGLRFHNGKPLTSSSVKYTLDQQVKDKTQYSFLGDSSVVVVDDSTLDIRPARANLRLPEQMVHHSYGIIGEGTDPATHPVCTGPFRFREYVAHDHLSVDRNDAYWREKSRLSRITFRFIPDDNTRAFALRAGNVDVIVDVNRSMVASLKATPGIRVVTAPPGAVILIYIATRGTTPNRLMSDRGIRRAVALSIDRRALVNHVMGGYATQVNTVNPPSVLGPFASLVHGIDYNPVLARHLLDSLGWKQTDGATREKHGVRLSLSMIVQSGTTVDRSIVQYVQAQLAEVGIDVRVDELDAAAFNSRLNSGTFDMDIELPNQNDANPAFLLALRWYSKSNVQSSPFMMIGERFDSLVDRSLSSVDRRDAQKAAAEAMHVLIDEEAAAIPLAGVSRIYAMSSRVRGFVPHPSRLNQSWSSVWLAK